MRVLLHHAVDTGVISTEASNMELVGSGSASSSITISRGKRGWEVEGADLSAAIRQSNVLLFRSKDSFSISGKKGRHYPGDISCIIDSDETDRFSIINVVEMSSYIPGVLAGELYEGWHNSTFEAQAVAARSYAISEIRQRVKHAWDVTDTPSTQAYHGVAYSQAVRCADATRGEILTWEGSLVPGYFSSCCGGAAATALEAVGKNPVNDVPPLTGHGDPAHCTDAPRYRWSKTWEMAPVVEALRHWGRRQKDDRLSNITSIRSMKSINPNLHGRPTHVEIVDQTGASTPIRCVDLPFVLARGGMEAPSSGWLNASVEGDKLKVNGHGFGHGVGLCQYGAESMGSTGADKKAILDFYYPGANITKAW